MSDEIKSALEAANARETELLNLVREMREALQKIENVNRCDADLDALDRLDIARNALAKVDATLKRLGVME